MAKNAGITRLAAVVILSLMILGIGGYFAPRLADVLAGRPVDWAISGSDSAVPDSVFGQQALLQQAYADTLQQDIVAALTPLVGRESVSATVRVRLALTRETERITRLTPMAEQMHQIKTTAGVIRSLSVSVLIDGHGRADSDVYRSRTRAEMAQYTRLVRTIVGADDERGDTVLVLNAPFEGRTVWGNRTAGAWGGGFVLVAFFGLAVWVICRFIIPVLRTMTVEDTGAKHTEDVVRQVNRLCRQYPERAATLIKNALQRTPTVQGLCPYGPAERAAMVVLSLDTAIAGDVLHYLPRKQMCALGRVMAALGTVSAREVRRAVGAFCRELEHPMGQNGTPERVERFLNQTVPNGESVYSEMCLTTAQTDLWTRLNQMDAETLADFLKTRSPETIAAILFRLNDAAAGRILMYLPSDLGAHVMIHLTHIRTMKPDVLERLTNQIAGPLYAFLRRAEHPTGRDKINTILNTMPVRERQAFVAGAAAVNPEWSRQMGDALMTFEDVATLDDRSLRTLLSRCDRRLMVLALTEASERVRSAVARHIPADVWADMERQEKMLTPAERTAAESARRTILQTARRLNLFHRA